MDRKSITIDLPAEKHKKLHTINSESLNKAKGIWKDKKIDGVKYQKKIRSEWD